MALTKREIEVLMAGRDGKSSQEIAKSLFVCKRTVDFHLQNAYEKLEVHNRIQALNRANELGLLPILDNSAK